MRHTRTRIATQHIRVSVPCFRLPSLGVESMHDVDKVAHTPHTHTHILAWSIYVRLALTSVMLTVNVPVECRCSSVEDFAHIFV